MGPVPEGERLMASPRNASNDFETDVLVIGGGTAGPLAAYKAKTADPSLKVLLVEKANCEALRPIAIGIGRAQQCGRAWFC